MKDLPHPEERRKNASRRTRDASSARASASHDSFTASKAGPRTTYGTYFPASVGIRGSDKEARNIAGAGLCSCRTLSCRGASVFRRFNSLDRRFYLPVGRIYFPVRSAREFPFGRFLISITCRLGLGRRTDWNRVFRSIFPSTREAKRNSGSVRN